MFELNVVNDSADCGDWKKFFLFTVNLLHNFASVQAPSLHKQISKRARALNEFLKKLPTPNFCQTNHSITQIQIVDA